MKQQIETLLKALETSNNLLEKQLEIQKRSIELIGLLLEEPQEKPKMKIGHWYIVFFHGGKKALVRVCDICGDEVDCDKYLWLSNHPNLGLKLCFKFSEVSVYDTAGSNIILLHFPYELLPVSVSDLKKEGCYVAIRKDDPELKYVFHFNGKIDGERLYYHEMFNPYGDVFADDYITCDDKNLFQISWQYFSEIRSDRTLVSKIKPPKLYEQD